jgi:hypothetical protein
VSFLDDMEVRKYVYYLSFPVWPDSLGRMIKLLMYPTSVNVWVIFGISFGLLFYMCRCNAYVLPDWKFRLRFRLFCRVATKIAPSRLR